MRDSVNKTISVSDVDFMGEYRLFHLFNDFASLATVHASECGIWNKKMEGKYGWIVAKQTLKFIQPIHLDDIITITTTIGKSTFVTFPRYYYIYNNDQLIAQCSSLWTLLDLNKRTIVSPKKIGLTIPQSSNKREESPKTDVLQF